MSAPTSPSWYDVLGVDADASTDQIRSAWRESIADLSPGDRRFRLLNQAAEVLLDDKAKADYDAELKTPTQAQPAVDPAEGPTRPRRFPGSQRGRSSSDGSAKAKRSSKDAETQPTSRPGGTVLLDEPDTAAQSTADPIAPAASAERLTGNGPPTWLLIPVAVVTALLVTVAVFLFTQPSNGSIQTNTDDAQSSAEQAVTTILAYDYRRMDADQKAADALMTSSYAAKYNQLFVQLKANAATVKPVVTVQVLASGIVRSGADRVQVLVFVNRPTTRADGTALYHDQVVATMVRSGSDWLVDNLQTNGG